MSILTNNGKRLTIGSSTALSFPSVIADGEGQLFNGLNQYDYISDNGTLDINQSTTDFCYGGYITTGSSYSGLIYLLGKQIAGNTDGRLQDIRIYHKDVSNQQADWMLGKQLGDEVAWWNLPTLTGFGGTPYNLTSVNL